MKQEIKNLICKGYLGKYINAYKKEKVPPTRSEHISKLNNLLIEKMVYMILGLSHHWVARRQDDEPSSKSHQIEPITSQNIIAFSDKDIKGVQTLYNDVVVVSTTIAKHDIKRIIVDNRNSVDLLLYDAF